MIVKMKFINISGPRNDIDRVTDLYLSRYEIQLESALSELKTVDNLRPFVEINPYKDALGKAEEFAGYLENADEISPDTSLGLDDIFELIRTTNEAYLKIQAKKEKLKKETETLANKQKLIEPFRPLDGELDRILRYKYINYRFGRIPVEQYGRLEKYLIDDLGAIFVKGEQDESYLYGAYFVSPGESQKVDAVFRSLHFEKITIPDEYTGTPADACQKLNRQIADISRKIEDLNKEAADMLVKKAPQIVAAKQRLEELAHNFDVRKMAARMEDQKEDYYILCGWMSEDDVARFMEEVKDDDKVFVVVEEDRNTYFGDPPVKLQNPKLFKPFEMFIGMYGLPAHNEIDPTIFVAVTYSFIFGVMFGDVGQGLLLLIGGFLIYHFKKKPLAGIIACAGVFSTIFGFMFGSIFGFEDIIEPIWLRPIDHMTTLPFIGKLNTVFIVSVAFGMGLIILAMILHIVNALRSHDVENAWFDANGRPCILRFRSGNDRTFYDRTQDTGRNRPCSDVRHSAASHSVQGTFDAEDPETRRQDGRRKGNVLCTGIFRDFRNLAELLFQHPFFRSYRCICRQPRCHDGSRADARRRRIRLPELDRCRIRQPVRMRYGRPDCRNSGTPSGIL